MVDWPDSWSVVTLGEAAQWWSGGTPRTSRPEFWGGKIPWITSGSLTEFKLKRSDRTLTEEGATHGSRMVPAGTTLFVVRGMSLKTEFRIGITTMPMAFGQDCKALRPRRAGLDELFLAYAIRAQSPYILGLVDEAGHGTGRLNTDQMKGLVLGVPPLPEQRAIVEVLGSLDDKIEANRRNVTLLSDFIAATWLGSFGVSSDGGWPTAPIGDLASVVGGSTPSTKVADFWDGTIAWATPRDLARLSSVPLLDTERHITELGLQQISSGLLPVGTVLLSSRAPIGYLAIAEVPLAVNQGFIALVAGRRVSNLYLWQWLRSHLDEVISRANGTIFLEVSKANFRPMPIEVPPEGLMRSWTASATAQYRLIVAKEQESGRLTQLRDAILPKLLSGELRVRDAETLVEEAV